MAIPKGHKTPQGIQTAQEFIAAYNTWNIDRILAVRALNCTQDVHPSSLGRPVRNNDQYRDYLKTMQSVISSFHLEPLEILEDIHRGKVVIHAKSSAVTRIGHFENEYVLILTLSEDRAKIVHVKDFLDSAFSKDFMGRLAEYQAR